MTFAEAATKIRENLAAGKIPLKGVLMSPKPPEEILKEEKSIIEDLIVAAHSNAKAKLKSKTTEEISKATGGFGIPGFKWPL